MHDGGEPVAEDFDHVGQRFLQPLRRFVKNQGGGDARQFRQLFFARGGLGRQKALKQKPVAGQTRQLQCR